MSNKPFDPPRNVFTAMVKDAAKSSNSIKREVDRLYKSCSGTQIRVVKFRHTWSINNFSSCCEETGQELVSALFSSGIKSDVSKWYLELYSKGKNKECSDWVSLFLTLNNLKSNEIMEIKVNMGCVDADGEDVIAVINHTIQFEESCCSWGYNEFMKRDYVHNEANRVLLDGKFTIFCEITAALDNEYILETLTPLQKGQIDLSKDLACLLENTEFSDITLCAGGKEFKAHKLILSARSSIFRAMFQTDIGESTNNRVNIDDIDEEAMCEMLRYMYTGRINRPKEMAPKLLGIAEKYAMDDLRMTCEGVLFKSLSVDNAADIFILSDKFNAKKLKKKVKIFIAAHTSEVGDTTGFQSLIRTHPHLGIEAFCAVGNLSIK